MKVQDYFVVNIRHSITNQEQLDDAIARLKLLGITPTNIRSIEDYLEWMEEEEADKTCDFSSYFINIVGKTMSLSPYTASEEDCICLVDNIIKIFGDKCKVDLETSTSTNYKKDVYLKWLPNCECGIVVYNQDGITYELVKELLEQNGFYNIELNKKCSKWMKIDFEADSIWIKNFNERYLKNNISSFEIYGKRNDFAYTYKKEYEFERKFVPIKNRNSFDFSDDDLSNDPRLW